MSFMCSRTLIYAYSSVAAVIGLDVRVNKINSSAYEYTLFIVTITDVAPAAGPLCGVPIFKYVFHYR